MTRHRRRPPLSTDLYLGVEGPLIFTAEHTPLTRDGALLSRDQLVVGPDVVIVVSLEVEQTDDLQVLRAEQVSEDTAYITWHTLSLLYQ